MDAIELEALLHMPSTQEAFLDAILAVAAVKLPALAALGINVDNVQSSRSVQAQSLHQMLINMLKIQGVDLVSGNTIQVTDSQHAALLRFIRICLALRNPTDNSAIWPFATLTQALDAHRTNTFRDVATQTVGAFYAIISAGIDAEPAATLAAGGPQ
jgi:hypothetical protein